MQGKTSSSAVTTNSHRINWIAGQDTRADDQLRRGQDSQISRMRTDENVESTGRMHPVVPPMGRRQLVDRGDEQHRTGPDHEGRLVPVQSRVVRQLSEDGGEDEDGEDDEHDDVVGEADRFEGGSVGPGRVCGRVAGDGSGWRQHRREGGRSA